MAEASRKRARSVEEKPNKRLKTQTRPRVIKRPLTLLSLPREIRQKVWNDSGLFDDAHKQDIALMNNLAIVKAATYGTYGPQGRIMAPHVASIASTLAAIHPRIQQDMPYVVEQQLKEPEQYNWSAAERTHDAASPPENYAQKTERWQELIWNAHPNNPKEFCKAMHQVVAAFLPSEIGCWKSWKFNNWKEFADICNVVDKDDSDLEEEMMDDEEWSEHMSNECDDYPNAST